MYSYQAQATAAALKSPPVGILLDPQQIKLCSYGSTYDEKFSRAAYALAEAVKESRTLSQSDFLQDKANRKKLKHFIEQSRRIYENEDILECTLVYVSKQGMTDQIIKTPRIMKRKELWAYIADNNRESYTCTAHIAGQSETYHNALTGKELD